MTKRRPTRPGIPQAVHNLTLGGVLAVIRIGQASIVIRDDAGRARGDYALALAELFQRKELSK